MHVADILKAKGDAVHTVRPDQNIEHLVHRLRMEGVGAMIVSASGDTVDGIISERDVVLGLTEHGTDIMKMSIADVMTRAVVTCSPADSIAHVARVMTQRRIRHLPVVEGRRVVGIVSVGDVVKQRMDELELETNVLRDYAVSRQH